jgi:parvulin-like peptidyl-prolyl isomerase
MRSALLGLALMLLPGIAAAQDTTVAVAAEAPQLRLLPEYTPCTVSGARYACFTADQVAQLNALEAQAQGWEHQLHLSETLRLQLDQLVINLQAQVALHQSIDDANEARIQELTTQLGHEIEQKNQYRAQAESTDYWPYIIGGAIGVLGVGFGVGALLAH